MIILVNLRRWESILLELFHEFNEDVMNQKRLQIIFSGVLFDRDDRLLEICRSSSGFCWCSGYHICLTRRRSQVRHLHRTFPVFFSLFLFFSMHCIPPSRRCCCLRDQQLLCSFHSTLISFERAWWSSCGFILQWEKLTMIHKWHVLAWCFWRNEAFIQSGSFAQLWFVIGEKTTGGPRPLSRFLPVCLVSSPDGGTMKQRQLCPSIPSCSMFISPST